MSEAARAHGVGWVFYEQLEPRATISDATRTRVRRQSRWYVTITRLVKYTHTYILQRSRLHREEQPNQAFQIGDNFRGAEF